MDLKQLHYFMTIVEEQQITAAARKLNMTQPPLSHQMKLLEKELGTQLFKRGSQCIELTEAGRLLVRRAQQLLDMAENTIREIDELGQSLQGTLSIGTISSSGSILLSPGMQKFHREYSGVHFEIHDANTYQLIEELEKGIRDTEEQLQAARRLYNANVSSYNQQLLVFPSSIIAHMRGLTKRDFFEAEEYKRADVKIEF